jgi:tetratricopeptide (TPR) repeat protein
MARKLTRKQIVKQDVVKSTFVHFWENLQAHPIRFTAIVVIVVSIILLAQAWWQNKAHKYERAQLTFSKVIAEFNDEEQPGTEDQKNSNQELKAKDYQQMEKDLTGIIRDFPQTVYEAQAQYYIGIIQMKQGLIDKAIVSFQKSSQSNQDAVTSCLAKFSLAKAYEDKAQYKEAIQQFQNLLNDQNSTVPRDYIYWELALVYEKQGNKADSKALLQKATNEIPTTPLRTQIDAKLKTL